LNGFPSTIVRPSHTYDRTSPILLGEWTIMDRMLNGKPIPVHGDGTSLWTLTHARDFALGLNGLLGNASAIGEAFHITSSEAPAWNTIFGMFAQALGVEAKIVHVPSDTMIAHNPEWAGSLIADRAHSAVFDNAKIKRFVPSFHPVVPFSAGVREIVEWRMGEASRRQIDPKMDALLDKVVTAQQRALAA